MKRKLLLAALAVSSIGVIPLTAFMLFLQGISELMKSLWAWRTGEFLTEHEKIEV